MRALEVARSVNKKLSSLAYDEARDDNNFFRVWLGLFCGFYGVAFALEEVEKAVIAGQVARTYHY